MSTELSSNNYRIIASGQSFLFATEGDLSVTVNYSDIRIKVRFVFETDPSRDQKIYTQAQDGVLIITCYNFNKHGMGVTKPEVLATVNGKKIYFMFWSYMEGAPENKIRSVKYTFFYEG